jgi:hypothetical protein
MFGLIFIAISFMSTDTVVLTTGEVIEGHFLGANEQTVQIQDKRGIVETIPREHVSTIRLAHTTNSTETPQPQPNQSPAEQRQFCALVERFQREQIAYFQETNPIRKASMPQPDPFRYEPEVQAIFGDERKFSRWTGTLRFSTSGRSIGIVFTPDCQPPQISIQFANAMEQPGLPTQDPATVIHTNSNIGQTLARAKSSNHPRLCPGRSFPSGVWLASTRLFKDPPTGVLSIAARLMRRARLSRYRTISFASRPSPFPRKPKSRASRSASRSNL